MPKYKVTFHEVIQDSQTFGSSDEHMVSRVFFSLNVDGGRVGDFFADLKQTVGSEFNSSDIEVSPPHDYHGPLDYAQFSEAVRDYFSRQFGPMGSAIRFSGGGNIRMRDNRSQQEREYDLYYVLDNRYEYDNIALSCRRWPPSWNRRPSSAQPFG
jgi:hypothetical protein